MPHYWIRVSLGTPDPLVGHKNKPSSFESQLKKIVGEFGGNARDVFFDADANVAYALVEDNDGNLDLTGLDQKLMDPKTLRVDLETAGEKERKKP